MDASECAVSVLAVSVCKCVQIEREIYMFRAAAPATNTRSAHTRPVCIHFSTVVVLRLCAVYVTC